MRVAPGRAARRRSIAGLALLATAAVGGVAAAAVPTKHTVNFDGLLDGSTITQVAGATFGAPTALGFPSAPPAYVCVAAPTARAGAAVASACPGRDPGSDASGLIVRLATPAQSVSVQVGTTQTAPGGFAAELDVFDSSGRKIGTDAALVGSSTSGQGTGPSATVSASVGSTESITYVGLFFNSFFTPGPQLVLDNLVYSSGGAPPASTTTTTGGSGTAPPATGVPTGTVLVNGSPYTGGTIPYGSSVDVTSGKLDLSTEAGRVTLFGGGGGVTSKFRLVRASSKNKRLVELRLIGGDFSACRKTASAGGEMKAKSVRRLWSKGKGVFRTQARFSSASVQGTYWLTDDRCDGTWTSVKQGVVTVRDFAKNKTVTLRAGQSYLAKPK